MRIASAAALAVSLMLSACDEPVAPDDLAGTYVLEAGTPAGDAPHAGSLRLDRDGSAVRTVSYTAQGGTREFVADGRYRFRDGRLELALSENNQPATRFVPVEYAPGVITLRYGHPADGPDIVEVYRK